MIWPQKRAKNWNRNFHVSDFNCHLFMIFAFKYMYMLLGVTLISSFLQKLFFNQRIKIQDGCQSFPMIAATKTAHVTLTF